MTTLHSVGVVGAGTMGQGIALVCASNGLTTFLYDIESTQVDNALKVIGENLRAAVDRGKMTPQEKHRIEERIHPATSLETLKADLIIEAAVERIDIKVELLKKLERINAGKAILATNTSSLSVSQIASRLDDPARCIGLHFFNPADKMKLVEIISGKATSPEIVHALRNFSKVIQKTAVLAKDSPGFIVNRVARPFYAEALKSLADGMAEVAAIDRLMRSCGFRMGPFELMDLIGVDTNLAVTTSVYEGLGRPSKFAPSPIQQQLVDAGHRGRKSGRGFYTYEKTV